MTLSEDMQRYPFLSRAFSRETRSPDQLIARLSNPPREVLTRDELADIAVVKVAGSGGIARIRGIVLSNDEACVAQKTEEALASNCPIHAVETLSQLNGVRVPVASAILAWTKPALWAVIDIRSWETLRLYEHHWQTRKIFSADDYGAYMNRVRELQDVLGWPAQKIDRWLYSFGRCGMRPRDFNAP